VILATFLGFPISTTHGLMGALVGAGLVAAGSGLNFAVLGTAFVMPLLLSPLLAVVVGAPREAIQAEEGRKLDRALKRHPPCREH
jgi:phosphate/sulfate permease